MSVYLDYAAATPLSPQVAEAMKPYWSDKFYNPSSLYLAAHDIKADIEEARRKVAENFGVKSAEIVFTAGGTEADNLALHGVARQFKDSHVVVSAIEHDAVFQSAKHYDMTSVGVSTSGRVDLEQLEKAICSNTVIVSIGIADNELGVIQPITQIKKLIDKERNRRSEAGDSRPLLFHTDASQAVGWIDLHPKHLGVDMMTVNGAKIYGPKQIGCLYVASGIRLQSLIDGGGHEQSLRSGTENVPSVVGFAKAVSLSKETKDYRKKIAKLRDDFEKQLLGAIPRAVINGAKAPRLANFSNFYIPGYDGERLVMELDQLGIQVATGAACSANHDQPSRSLLAIGLSKPQANASLRVSMSKATSSRELDKLLQSLLAVIKDSDIGG